MSDHGILFSPPMIRALLAGRKTQTRRPLLLFDFEKARKVPDLFIPHPGDGAYHLSRIKAGDRAWVKENYRFEARWDGVKPTLVHKDAPVYPETDPYEATPECAGVLRPSIFMPRRCSRLTLEVAAVRIEQLLDISEADAVAEGIEGGDEIVEVNGNGGFHNEISGLRYREPSLHQDEVSFESAGAAYLDLWEHINGPGSVDLNPWVAAYTFEVRRENIDA